MSYTRGLNTLLIAGLCGLAATAEAAVTPSAETVPGLALDAIPGSVTVDYHGHRADLELLGSGVRKQLMFKVYEAAVYTEPGADLSRPYQSLAAGKVLTHMRLVFLRDTTGPKVRSAVEKGFNGAHGLEHAFGEPLEILLNYLQDGMEAGKTLGLTWIPGEVLIAEAEDREPLTITDPAFGGAVLAVWFGPDCVDEGLKKGMLRLYREGKP